MDLPIGIPEWAFRILVWIVPPGYLEGDTMETMMRAVGTTLCLLLAAAAARGDTLTFPSGGEMKGVVMSQNDDALVIRIRHGLMTLSPTQVASVTKDDPATTPTARLAAWDACFGSLRNRPWGPGLRPMSAIIIDSGLFRNVPYSRDVSGTREFSLYGDPDAPAGYEIGLSKSLAASADARKEAAQAIAALLSDPKDKETLASLKLSDTGKAERAGLTFQIEKGSNADGDETWWLSVYDERALMAARVSEKDLPKPTVAADPEGAGRGTTVTGSKTTSGKGEPQESISPIGSEPDNPSMPPRGRSYARGGGSWANWWHHHGGAHPPKPSPPKK